MPKKQQVVDDDTDTVGASSGSKELSDHLQTNAQKKLKGENGDDGDTIENASIMPDRMEQEEEERKKEEEEKKEKEKEKKEEEAKKRDEKSKSKSKSKKSSKAQQFTYKFTVHVHSARDLKYPVEDPPGVVAQIQVKPKNQPSSVRFTEEVVNTATPYWDQSFTFKLTMTAQEFEEGYVRITVYATKLQYDSYVGDITLDFLHIYSQAGHVLNNQWCCLSSPSSPGSAQGLLLVSSKIIATDETDQAAAFQSTGDDEHHELVVDREYIEVVPYLVAVSVYQGEGFPAQDASGTCDSYVKVTFNDRALTTKVQPRTTQPQFNEEMRFSYHEPGLADEIWMDLFSYDMGRQDIMLGRAKFSFKEIANSVATEQWINIYGPLRDSALSDTGLKDIIGFEYKGRVLAKVYARRDDNAANMKTRIPSIKAPPRFSYTLRIDVIEGRDLPYSEDTGMEGMVLQFHWASTMVDTKPINRREGVYQWAQQLPDTTCSEPVDRSMLPDLFIYSSAKQRGMLSRTAYCRVPAAELFKWRSETHWLQMTPVYKKQQYDPRYCNGMIAVRINLAPTSEVGATRPALRPERLRSYELRTFVYQGRDFFGDLMTPDSAPYVAVSQNAGFRRTTAKPGSYAPEWFETMKYITDLPNDLENAPPVRISVLSDKEGIPKLIGQVSVKATEVYSNKSKDGHLNPSWLQFDNFMGRHNPGAVFIAFQLVPLYSAGKIPVPNIIPKRGEVNVEIHVLGLRSLRTVDGQRPRSVFLEARLGTETSLGITKVSKHPSPTDPNFAEVFQLTAIIPTEALLAPYITFRVFDSKGRDRSVIGDGELLARCVVPAGRYMKGGKALDEDEDTKEAGVVGEGEDDEDIQKNETVEAMDIKVDLNDINMTSYGETRFDGDKSHMMQLEQETVKGLRGLEFDENDLVEDDRKKVYMELEKSDVVNMPFQELPLYRCQGGARDQLFGYVKAKIRIGRDHHDDTPVNMLQMIPKNNRGEINIQHQVTYVVRVYVVEIKNVVPKDITNLVVPYFDVRTHDEHEEMIENDRNDVSGTPVKVDNIHWSKCYEVPFVYPQQTKVLITMYDKNDGEDAEMTDDRVVGFTEIDLENRLYCADWRGMNSKPIEYRPLNNPSVRGKTGILKSWVDIYTRDEAARIPQASLATKAVELFELRVIIWEVRNLKVEKKRTDVAVQGSFMDQCVEKLKGDPTQTSQPQALDSSQSTPVNWRMLFPVENPCTVTRFRVTAWDTVASESIGEAVLDLTGLFSKSRAYRRTERMPKQWVPIMHLIKEGKQGDIKMEIEILPRNEARMKPCGKGRSKPNQFPHLEDPKVSQMEAEAEETRRKMQSWNPRDNPKMWWLIGGVIAGVGGSVIIVLLLGVFLVLTLQLTGSVKIW